MPTILVSEIKRAGFPKKEGFVTITILLLTMSHDLIIYRKLVN